MATKRFRFDVQGELSTTPGSVVTSNSANKPVYLAPPAADRGLMYDHSAGLLQWFTLGAGLSWNGTVLETSAGSGFISEIQDEGSSLGAGLTTIDFVGAGITATAGGAIATVSLDADLNALAGLGSIGYAVRTAADTWAQRTLTGTAGRLSVTNGDGTSGNPVFNIDSNVAFKNANETVTGSWTFNNAVLAATVPTLGDHLVNKTYVDGLLAGVRRTSVRAATVAAGTLATSFENGDTIDTIVLATNDRILIKDQAAPAENGVYIVQASGAPIRALDMDAAGEVDGTLVIVEDGSQQGQQWYTVSEVVTLNTDPITFTKLETGTVDGSGATNQITYWADSNTLTGNANYLFDPGVSPQMVIGDTAVTLLTVLTTKGTTANNAAFGWVHKDSGGSQVFRVSNDGTTVIGSSNATTIANGSITRAADLAIGVTGTGSEINITSESNIPAAIKFITFGTGGVHVSNNLATHNGSVLDVFHGTTRTYTSGGAAGLINVAGAYTVASGTGQMTDITLISTINQTGTATGITRGLHVIPTLTAAVDYRAVELTANSSHYAMMSTAGKWRIDLGSDATGDMFYRAATTGNLTRLGIGTAQQVLIGGTIPAWGSAPVTPTECFVKITGAPVTAIDLDANDGTVKDRDGANIAFTIPTVGQKMDVYRGGMLLDSDGAGGSPSRDYSVNTTTHVLTFNEAVNDTETIYIRKFA
jgi:hypothetical protein